MRLARRGDRDALAVEDLLPEDNYGGMPVLDRQHIHVDHEQGTLNETHQIPSICLPVNCRDIRLARPLLRS